MMQSKLTDVDSACQTVWRLTWPPNQPKEFTPLLLIHHQNQHTLKEENAPQLATVI